MGKLAVPEYILNKPGSLTRAEFDKMKLHASVGADILSAIDFPYPVTPIVRHHHENWDGTGYPRGLPGTEIPIGARILSVVDCFDALTSDRPYRPRLTDEEALRILIQRRGSMYDPLVVDTFVQVHAEIAPGAVPQSQGPSRDALNEITDSTLNQALAVGSAGLEEIAASADEMLTLYELARALAGEASFADTGDVIAKHLRRLVPSCLCVFYLYDTSKDEIEAKHATGDSTSIVKGIRMSLGQRLSGWVAANRQTIVNSDPILDLGEVARTSTPRLRSCLSTPLISNNELVGVLTLYSGTLDAFNEDHRRIVEVVARNIAQTFRRAAEFGNPTKCDPVAALPSIRQLDQLTDSISVSRTSLLFIHVNGLRRINTQYGRLIGDDILRHVVQHTRSALRGADILFRYGGDEFVAFLNDADFSLASEMASRIRASILHDPLTTSTLETIAVHATVTCVTAPRDGQSLADLLAAARIRGDVYRDRHEGPSVH